MVMVMVVRMRVSLMRMRVLVAMLVAVLVVMGVAVTVVMADGGYELARGGSLCPTARAAGSALPVAGLACVRPATPRWIISSAAATSTASRSVLARGRSPIVPA